MMITILDLNKWKKEREKFVAITAYDATFANLFFEQGIKVILVGDSLGMTIQGNDSTVPVTLQDIIYHTKCVRKGAPNCFLLSDLPFMNYPESKEAFENTIPLMQAGTNMIKIEGGGQWIEDIVNYLTIRSVPICCHLGLTPQSINMLGKYRMQGLDKCSAEKIFSDALELEKAGAKMLVLEYVDANLAKHITEALTIPVIGIGSGNFTDGQILVMHDILGVTIKNKPPFAKNFLEGNSIAIAIKNYIKEVKSGKYP